MVFISVIIILFIILKSEIYSITFNNSGLVTKNQNFTSIIHSVVKPIQTFCIMTLDFSDLLDFLLKLEPIVSNGKYILTEIVTIPNDCDYLLVLEMPDSLVCNLFLKYKKRYLNLSNFVIIFNTTFADKVDQLNQCSSVFDSANVALVSLLSNNIFLLSSPLLSPRSFIPFDFEEFILHVLNLSTPSFQGTIVNAVTFHHPPFSVMKKRNNSAEFSGMEINFFKELTSYLNFTLRIVNLESADTWGISLQNGTTEGGVFQVLRDGKADLVICNLWQQDVYLQDMDYGPPFNMIYLAFIVRRPYQLSSRWQSFTGIFSVDVWATTFVAFLAITIVFWFAQNISNNSQISLVESGVMMFGILTVSASYVSSHRLFRLSTRFIVIWWFFFSLLFVTAVMSCIVTQLTLPLYSPRMDSIKQLVQNDYYWIDPAYSNRKNGLKNFYFNLNDSWQILFEAQYEDINLTELEDYLQNDRKITLPVQSFENDFVLVNTKGIHEETDLRNFRVMNEHLRETYTSFGFRKHSPFNEPLSRAILKLLDRGIFQYWRRKFTNHKANRRYLLDETDLRIFQKPEKLVLWKLYPIFVVLFLGYALAGSVFLVELFY